MFEWFAGEGYLGMAYLIEVVGGVAVVVSHTPSSCLSSQITRGFLFSFPSRAQSCAIMYDALC